MYNDVYYSEVMDQYYSIKQVASRFNVNPMTVRRWILSKLLPAIRLSGSYRISELDIDLFIANRRTGK